MARKHKRRIVEPPLTILPRERKDVLIRLARRFFKKNGTPIFLDGRSDVDLEVFLAGRGTVKIMAVADPDEEEVLEILKKRRPDVILTWSNHIRRLKKLVEQIYWSPDGPLQCPEVLSVEGLGAFMESFRRSKRLRGD